MPNIQNFAQQGLTPRQVNLGGPIQAPAQQQITRSQMLGQILGQPQAPQQEDPFAGLQAAILQKGAQDSLLRKQQQGQVANQVGANIIQNQIIPGA